MNVIQKNSPRIQSGIADRVIVDGKFLAAGGRRFSIRGVTYGTFRPDLAGEEYSQAVVARDFAAMEAAGFNAVRLYTAPPRWLLDTALQHGLRVMIGLAWEQHVAFLDDIPRPARFSNG